MLTDVRECWTTTNALNISPSVSRQFCNLAQWPQLLEHYVTGLFYISRNVCSNQLESGQDALLNRRSRQWSRNSCRSPCQYHPRYISKRDLIKRLGLPHAHIGIIEKNDIADTASSINIGMCSGNCRARRSYFSKVINTNIYADTTREAHFSSLSCSFYQLQ